jgi:hypothetical protein
MTVEYIKAFAFFQEVNEAGRVWIARSVYKNIYAQEVEEGGYSLPIWSTRERVVDYLKNARPLGPKYEPDEIPLDVFTGAWLSDMRMNIVEVQINPDGTSTRVLVLTNEEFTAAQASK